MTIFKLIFVRENVQYDCIQWEMKRNILANQIKVTYLANLASTVRYCCLKFPSFRRSFILYIEKENAKNNITAVEVTLLEYKTDFNRRWDHIVAATANKRYQLDDAMNWLNTLGGGYSALGDYYDSFARKAGEISLHQLKVALLLGDDVIKCRCFLYMAQSFMQRGLLKRSRLLLRKQFIVAKELKDDKLIAVCKGLWSRLQYVYDCNKQH